MGNRERVVGGRRAELTLSCLAKSPRIYTKARVTTRAPMSITEIIVNKQKRRTVHARHTPYIDFWKIVSVCSQPCRCPNYFLQLTVTLASV
jgi:hypothetical protein